MNNGIELGIMAETRSVLANIIQPSNSYQQLSTLDDQRSSTITDVCQSPFNITPNYYDSHNESKVCLKWTNLTYTVPKDGCVVTLLKKLVSSHPQTTNRRILHEQNGFIKEGEMMVIIGRSGSGKSSLLECLSGGKKLKHATGSIHIGLSDPKRKHVNVCYIPQVDHLMPTLSVRESLRFAYHLRNRQIFGCDKCESKIDSLISDLNLQPCANTLVSKISGGQRKRLSIGLELLGNPDIFILDEPTSGLDSSNALHCIRILQKLCQANNLAILVSMHQPSAKILQLFHKLYLLSYDGRLIYYGSSNELTSHLATFDLVCPSFHNPADYAIEIASGEYGVDKIQALELSAHSKSTSVSTESEINECNNLKEFVNFIDIRDIINRMLRKNPTSISHFLKLLQRSLLTTIRDPSLNTFRLVQHVLVGLIVIMVYSSTIGNGSGCFDSNSLEEITLSEIRQQERLTSQNLALMFFSLMFLTFAAMMPTVMVFPVEMSVFVKERKNGWYSCASFYLAKTLADLPYQLSYTLIYVALVYFGTGQPLSQWRFLLFLTVSMLISLIGQSFGLLFGAVFIKYLQTAIFIAPVSTLPLILISGFFVKISTMPKLVRPFANLSYLKFAFESMIVSLYGFGRCLSPKNSTNINSTDNCSVLANFFNYIRNDLSLSFDDIRSYLVVYVHSQGKDTQKLDTFSQQLEAMNLTTTSEKFFQAINTSQSLVMTEYELKDESMIFNATVLLIFVFAIRILTYFVLLLKSGRTQ